MNQFKHQIEELVRAGLLPMADLTTLRAALVNLDAGKTLPQPQVLVLYRFIANLTTTVLTNPPIARQVRHQVLDTNRKTRMKKPVTEAHTGVQAKSNHSDAIKAQVKADMEKRRNAHKDTISAAKKELADNPPEKKSYRKLFKKESVEGETVDETTNYSKLPAGALETLAKTVANKLANGGKPTENDRELTYRAKAELKKRKETKESVEVEELSVTDKFLADHGVASVDELTDEQQQELVTLL